MEEASRKLWPRVLKSVSQSSTMASLASAAPGGLEESKYHTTGSTCLCTSLEFWQCANLASSEEESCNTQYPILSYVSKLIT